MTYFFRLPNLAFIALIFLVVRFSVFLSLGQSMLQHWEYVILCLSVINIAAAGYIVNNIYDVKIDAINRPNKNPVGQTLSVATAWRLYFAFNILAIAGTAYFMNLRLWLLHGGAILLLWAYSFMLKKQAFIGNLVVAALAALLVVETFLFDFSALYALAEQQNATAQRTLFLLILYVGFSFLTTLQREIVKDMEDMEGDRKMGCRTLPIIWGIERTKSLCLGVFAALAMALVMQTQMLWKTGQTISAIYSGIVLILPLFYFIYRLRQARQTTDFSYISRWLKIYMLFGLLLLLF